MTRQTKPNQNAYIGSFAVGCVTNASTNASMNTGFQLAARASPDRTLAPEVQRGVTEESAGWADIRRLCETVKPTPNSKLSRYSKRGDVAAQHLTHHTLLNIAQAIKTHQWLAVDTEYTASLNQEVGTSTQPT